MSEESVPEVYDSPRYGGGVIRPLIGMAVSVAFVFFLLPFTQFLQNLGNREDDQLRNVSQQPPPDVPPPVEEEPPPEPEPEEPPEMEQEVPEISLSNLEVAISAGPGDFGGAFGLQDFTSVDLAAEDLIFDVRDLDRVPKLRRPPRLQYPFDLQRQGIEGYVRLRVLIDKEGNVEVLDVVDSSNRGFDRNAIEGAEGALFEPPIKDGKAVRARYVWTLRFTLGRRR